MCFRDTFTSSRVSFLKHSSVRLSGNVMQKRLGSRSNTLTSETCHSFINSQTSLWNLHLVTFPVDGRTSWTFLRSVISSYIIWWMCFSRQGIYKQSNIIYSLWCGCRLMADGMNFPEWRGGGWPGEGGILPAAAAAPRRWASMERPANNGGGPWTDRGGPKSLPSIIHSGESCEKNSPFGYAPYSQKKSL